MSAGRRSQISSTLAHYLGLGQNELFPRLRLGRDLGLQPLDLVLFVMGFEESDGLDFPFDELEQVATVGELVLLVSDWLEGFDRSERLAADEELFGLQHGSGTFSLVPRASGQ